MKAWEEDGKTLTEEYQAAHWDLYWAVCKQKAVFDASILAITAVGGRGVDGALKEIEKMEELLLQYKDFVCLKEQNGRQETT